MAPANCLPQILNKQWPPIFSTSRKPSDQRPYLDGALEGLQAAGHEPDGDDSKMFMEAYDDDTTSSNIRNAIKYLQTVGNNMLHEQASTGKEGTAWLDDRSQHRKPPQICAVHVGGTSSSITTVNDIPTPPNSVDHMPITSDECDITDAAVSCPKIRRVTCRKGAHICSRTKRWLPEDIKPHSMPASCMAT